MSCLLLIFGSIMIGMGKPAKDGTPSGVPWMKTVGSLFVFASFVWVFGFAMEWWSVG